MNLRNGKVKNYNNKILTSSTSFKIGTNLKINLDGKKDKPDVKSKKEEKIKTEPDIKSNKEHKQDVKLNIEFNKESKQDVKPNIEFNKESKQDVKPNIKFNKESKPNMNKITCEEEKVALILGITSIFTVW